MRYLFFLLFISCQTPVNDLNGVYQKDLLIRNNSNQIIGFGSLPKASSYQFLIEARKEPEIVRISSCHRDVVIRDPGDERFSYKYIPSKNIEDNGSCILQIATFDEKGRHQFGAVDFLDDETLSANIYCNGNKYPRIGVSTCQARAETLQAIEFKENVEVFAGGDCVKPTSEDGLIYTYSVRQGYCIFVFSSETAIHRHTVFGYNDIMKRK